MQLLILLTLIPYILAADLAEKWGDLWPFQGVATFAHLEHFSCLIEPDKQFDIGIIGVPFDTAVSYRPGAPDKYPSFWESDQNEINHGSMLWKAHEEGLTSKTNIHAGLRTKLSGIEDLQDDDEQDFVRIGADDIWLKGPEYVVNKILKTIPKDTPTYISVDVDVLDPGFTSGTGTQEPGGWLPRELIHI
ncbi:Guanidinobutyrase [Candida viswanathii]|uniref:Guanidinobutyrase n=1 Tax=Candida viswanathii TaxID=5486 RepID=A0A367XUM8_9ASCO|nr:Guanidinobutyrase [Candida viswanathii]